MNGQKKNLEVLNNIIFKKIRPVRIVTGITMVFCLIYKHIVTQIGENKMLNLEFKIECCQTRITLTKRVIKTLHGLVSLNLIMAIINFRLIGNPINLINSIAFGALIMNMVWLFYYLIDNWSDLKREKPELDYWNKLNR